MIQEEILESQKEEPDEKETEIQELCEQYCHDMNPSLTVFATLQSTPYSLNKWESLVTV